MNILHHFVDMFINTISSNSTAVTRRLARRVSHVRR